MKNKKVILICIIIAISLLLSATIIFLIIKNNSTVVNVIPPSNNINDGSTQYEVSGAKSTTEANEAIIKKAYENNRHFRTITHQELHNIAESISDDGCKQITKSQILGPPVNDAVNWRNFSDENNNSITVYMINNQYTVQTKCSNR